MTPGFPVVARFMLLRAPGLAEHIAGAITSKAAVEGEGGGGGGDPRKLPFNGTAFDDAHKVCAILAGLCELVGQTPPADTWRNSDGRIVGYKGRTDAEGIYRYTVAATVTLKPHIDALSDLDEQDKPIADRLIKRLAQIDTRWPRHDTGTFLSHPCLCGERIVVQPPVWEGAEQMIVCTGCGALYDEKGAARIRAIGMEVAKHDERQRKFAAREMRKFNGDGYAALRAAIGDGL